MNKFKKMSLEELEKERLEIATVKENLLNNGLYGLYWSYSHKWTELSKIKKQIKKRLKKNEQKKC